MRTDKFRQQHNDIMHAVTELRGLIKAGIGDNAASIARQLVTMSSTIKLHLSVEDSLLYPALKNSGNAAAIALGTRYQADMEGLANTYLAFSRKWLAASPIASEPDTFRNEANAVFRALHERIKRENTELYPLFETL